MELLKPKSCDSGYHNKVSKHGASARMEKSCLFLDSMMPRLLIISFFLLLPVVGCNDQRPAKEATPPQSPPAVEQTQTIQPRKASAVSQIRAITRSEELIQKLTGKKSMLAKMLTGDEVKTSSFAHSEVNYYGLAKTTLESLSVAAVSDSASVSDQVTFTDIAIDKKARTIKASEIWRELPLQFEDAQLGVLKGTFLKESLFQTDMKFEGRMRSPEGKRFGVKSKVKVIWKNIGNGWKVDSWKPSTFTVSSSKTEMFRDVTDAAFPDAETRKRLATASHEDLIVKRCIGLQTIVEEKNGRKVKSYAIREARKEFKGCNDWGSVGQYPSVSTVDFDADGFDDLFVTDRWQSPQLLRNNGDFTFTDVAEEAGIDIKEMATCGYFFDFDNDGDSDLLVGMSMVPSRFYVNEGGKFQPHEAINKTLEETRFVNAISVADINRDGLLDLYLSTYATGTGPIDDWIEFVTRESEQQETKRRIESADKFVDRAGPPNILLLNKGDNFEWAEIDDTLKQYRMCYQSSWMDVDGDGDHDLYICNDFSPDVFLRNDTPRGSFEVAFTDITEQIIPTMDMGFGMGCDWADYDNDGDLDLYVSNMYSKAGNRIVDQIDGTSPRLKVAAHGNFLFENTDGKFKQVAGDGDGMQHVARVGWSYGGQFADFDNDGQLDLYVPSGCYSAPQEVQAKLDL
jgi:hypothetical protein